MAKKKDNAKSKFRGWKPKVPDLPGQSDIFGEYVKSPDESNAKCAQPLLQPERPHAPLRPIRMIVKGQPGEYVTYWEDDLGNVVGYGPKHPYTNEKY